MKDLKIFKNIFSSKMKKLAISVGFITAVSIIFCLLWVLTGNEINGFNDKVLLIGYAGTSAMLFYLLLKVESLPMATLKGVRYTNSSPDLEEFGFWEMCLMLYFGFTVIPYFHPPGDLNSPEVFTVNLVTAQLLIILPSMFVIYIGLLQKQVIHLFFKDIEIELIPITDRESQIKGEITTNIHVLTDYGYKEIKTWFYFSRETGELSLIFSVEKPSSFVSPDESDKFFEREYYVRAFKGVQKHKYVLDQFAKICWEQYKDTLEAYLDSEVALSDKVYFPKKEIYPLLVRRAKPFTSSWAMAD